MADGYARASGKVGVAIATSGPGATNLVTGIATAMLDSIPIVCITGQVSSKVLGTDAFQEVDITGITLPVTKHNFLVTRAEDIAPAIREAFQIAQSGRPGPVLVDITKDAQQATAIFDFEAAKPAPYRPHPMLRVEDSGLTQAAELIRNAKRPVILAGHGIIRIRRRCEQVRTLAERAQIPVALTLLGLGGFPASHPLNLGMMGMHGEVLGQQRHPGSRPAHRLRHALRRPRHRHTSPPTRPTRRRFTSRSTPPRSTRTSRSMWRSSAISREVLEAAAAAHRRPRRIRRGSRRSNASKGACRRARHQEPARHRPPLRRARHARHLAHATGGNAIVVTDVGQHQMWEAQYFQHEHPRTLITSGGLGTMGFALPAAIGAKIACPDKEVWVIAGDGGFQMTAAELSTIVQENLKINIAVINNGYLGMVRQWQEFFYDKNYEASPTLSPDFVKLADAHGIPGRAVRTRAEVAARRRRGALRARAHS